MWTTSLESMDLSLLHYQVLFCALAEHNSKRLLPDQYRKLKLTEWEDYFQARCVRVGGCSDRSRRMLTDSVTYPITIVYSLQTLKIPAPKVRPVQLSGDLSNYFAGPPVIYFCFGRFGQRGTIRTRPLGRTITFWSPYKLLHLPCGPWDQRGTLPSSASYQSLIFIAEQA